MFDVKLSFLSPVAEVIYPIAAQYAFAAISNAASKGVKISNIGVTERTLIHTARNQLAKGFLDSGDEWAFWWDCDVVMEPDTITRLLNVAKEKDAKMVTGVYYQRLGKHFPVLWKKDPVGLDGEKISLGPARNAESEKYRSHYLIPHPDAKKPLQADIAGFGCMLTHRSVFDGMAFPWFKTLTGVCSEDFYFCVNARGKGVQLWADPSIRLGHISKPQVVFKEHLQFDNLNKKAVKLGA